MSKSEHKPMTRIEIASGFVILVDERQYILAKEKNGRKDGSPSRELLAYCNSLADVADHFQRHYIAGKHISLTLQEAFEVLREGSAKIKQSIEELRGCAVLGHNCEK